MLAPTISTPLPVEEAPPAGDQPPYPVAYLSEVKKYGVFVQGALMSQTDKDEFERFGIDGGSIKGFAERRLRAAGIPVHSSPEAPLLAGPGHNPGFVLAVAANGLINQEGGVGYYSIAADLHQTVLLSDSRQLATGSVESAVSESGWCSMNIMQANFFDSLDRLLNGFIQRIQQAPEPGPMKTVDCLQLIEVGKLTLLDIDDHLAKAAIDGIGVNIVVSSGAPDFQDRMKSNGCDSAYMLQRFRRGLSRVGFRILDPEEWQARKSQGEDLMTFLLEVEVQFYNVRGFRIACPAVDTHLIQKASLPQASDVSPTVALACAADENPFVDDFAFSPESEMRSKIDGSIDHAVFAAGRHLQRGRAAINPESEPNQAIRE